MNLNFFWTVYKQLEEDFKKAKKASPFLQKQISTFVINYNNSLADIVRNAETEIKTLRGEGYWALGRKKL